MIKIHKWTHTGDKVLIVKCVDKDGKGHGGFQWPKAGPVKPDNWSRKPDCESGGLFGWAWGLGVGEGKDPNATTPWIVFSAKPENVIGEIEGGLKCKAVPSEDGTLPEVVYYGTMAGAFNLTHAGRMAWINKNAESATSGYRSSAATSGDSSSAATSGDSSSAATSGYRSSAATSGDSSSAATSGYRSSAATSGDRSSAATSGDSSSAATSGDSSSAATSGYRSSAATSGDSSSAATSGDRSIASACGEYVSIDPSATSIGVAFAYRCKWIFRKGAVIAVRWERDEKYGHVLFNSKSEKFSKVKDGDILFIQGGKIVKEFTY